MFSMSVVFHNLKFQNVPEWTHEAIPALEYKQVWVETLAAYQIHWVTTAV